MPDSQSTLDLIAASLDLIAGTIDDETWLKKLAGAINADSALSIRWTSGLPETRITSSFGNYNNIPTGWYNWADHMIKLAKPEQCMFMEEIEAAIGRPELSEANPLNDEQLLYLLADWTPAYIFIFVHRDESAGKWSKKEKERFLTLCNYVRRAILVHKKLAQAENMANATVDILNSSPRGVLALSTDGKIQFANTLAQRVLMAKDGISSSEEKLLLKDPESHAVLDDFIATAKLLNLGQLADRSLNGSRSLAIKRNSGLASYQLMLNAVPLSSWKIETSPSDRMIIVYLHDPDFNIQPTEEDLINYFDLTKAQAKVAARLYSNDNLVGVAAQLKISVNTARSHLRAIYTKTGAKNQMELTSLLTRTLKTLDNDSG
jgi:DNA-binding CsgD family transcriptional regulator